MGILKEHTSVEEGIGPVVPFHKGGEAGGLLVKLEHLLEHVVEGVERVEFLGVEVVVQLFCGSVGRELNLFLLPKSVERGGILLFCLLGFRDFIFDLVVFGNKRVESVLDHILWPSNQALGYLGPSGPKGFVEVDDQKILLLTPRLSIDLWVQFIDKPLPNLLSSLRLQLLAEYSPILPIHPNVL